MELMSSLLLCALVAYFPQALGVKHVNSGIENHQLNSSKEHKKIYYLHDPRLNVASDLQSVFMDTRCKKCIDCMGRAIHKYKSQTNIAKTNSTDTKLRGDVLSNLKNRIKRNADVNTTALPKKVKSKKKASKAVSVTKYNIDGVVYGLKVKESMQHAGEQIENTSSICRIYSVKKSYDCDSPESESFLAAKRKISKKNKKEKTTTLSTTQKTILSAASFRKRQVDPSEMPDNYELSIEGMY